MAEIQEKAAPAKVKKKPKLKIKSWYSNRYQIILVQRNILLLFSILAVVSMFFAIAFVKYVVASKSLEPYIIEIEEKTGVATVVQQLKSESFTEHDAMKKYFINQYVQASTAYDPKTYKIDAGIVRLFSAPEVYNRFRKRIKPSELGAQSKIEVRIKSIQFPSTNTAQIRILRKINIERERPQTKDELITIGFYFTTGVKLAMEERLINPLGFQVTSYSIAEESFDY